jgi:hypothetical protein
MRVMLAAAFALVTASAAAQEPPPVTLDPAGGSAVGASFQAWLSPHQEGAEEDDVPALAPADLKSTAPSVPRNERTSRGHGMVRFSRDLSRAWVDIAVENVKAEDIVLFHIHCGRPGMLGPIIVDFGMKHDLPAEFADGRFSVEVHNEDIEHVVDHGHGFVGFLTAGCPIFPENPVDRVRTIAGMETIAREGELYFNLHTKGQTFFGDIRGQLRPMD